MLIYLKPLDVSVADTNQTLCDGFPFLGCLDTFVKRVRVVETRNISQHQPIFSTHRHFHHRQPTPSFYRILSSQFVNSFLRFHVETRSFTMYLPSGTPLSFSFLFRRSRERVAYRATVIGGYTKQGIDHVCSAILVQLDDRSTQRFTKGLSPSRR